jgi:predicted nucleic-acid-binding Zn-ribbon protein
VAVDHANYSTAKLADVDDHYYYGVSCQSCLRSARISLTKLCSVLGGDYPLVKVVKRLKCRTCGSKEITVTFLAPNQAVGSLTQLFEKKPV